MLLGICSTELFAATLSSGNYALFMPRVVSSSGSAGSANYNIKDVCIGSLFGGLSQSANYSLNAAAVDTRSIAAKPNPPVLNQVLTPTNNSVQTLSGTKDKDTAIYLNGYEYVPLDNKASWSCDVTLKEGENSFLITARNSQHLDSASVSVEITLDTRAPFIVITDPVDLTILWTNPITVKGTIDAESFEETRTLESGANKIVIDAEDEAGNKASKAIEVYLIKEPLMPKA